MESLLLAAIGGAAGIGLAILIDRALIDFLPGGRTPVSFSSTPDWTVLAFTFAISLLAGILFGLVPALQATRPDLAGTLKDEAGAVIHGGSARLRKCLAVSQVALSLVLLIGAELFLQSLHNLKTLNPGFDVENLLAFSVDPTLNRYDLAWARDYYRRLNSALAALPAVESHTLAVVPVLENNEWDNWVTIEGYTAKPDERPDPHMQYCSPGYFKTLKIPLMLGRDFTERDIAGAPKVAIVNQKFVKRCPWEVVVSTGSPRLFRPTFRWRRSLRISIRFLSERPSRSSFQITSTSPARTASINFADTGRSAFAPLTVSV